jgi:hypothetical protein
LITKKKEIFLIVSVVVLLTINLVYFESFSTGIAGPSGTSRLEDGNIISNNNTSNMTNTTIAANTE